jgi:hypothetical protein
MKFGLLLKVFFLFFTVPAFAQTAQSDTVKMKGIKIDIHNSNWGVRFCNGIQNSFYFDIGISRDHFLGSVHGMYSDAIFVAFSMFPSFKSNIETVYGLKGGAEFWGNGMGLGIETGYFKNNSATDFILTPKIGFGISQANIVYGYGFSANNHSIPRIGKHTISLQLDIPFKTKNKLKKA